LLKKFKNSKSDDFCGKIIQLTENGILFSLPMFDKNLTQLFASFLPHYMRRQEQATTEYSVMFSPRDRACSFFTRDILTGERVKNDDGTFTNAEI
jgi:hypothetical protein